MCKVFGLNNKGEDCANTQGYHASNSALFCECEIAFVYERPTAFWYAWRARRICTTGWLLVGPACRRICTRGKSFLCLDCSRHYIMATQREHYAFRFSVENDDIDILISRIYDELTQTLSYFLANILWGDEPEGCLQEVRSYTIFKLIYFKYNTYFLIGSCFCQRN